MVFHVKQCCVLYFVLYIMFERPPHPFMEGWPVPNWLQLHSTVWPKTNHVTLVHKSNAKFVTCILINVFIWRTGRRCNPSLIIFCFMQICFQFITINSNIFLMTTKENEFVENTDNTDADPKFECIF